MTQRRSLRTSSLLLAVLLAGCQSALPLASPGPALSLVVELALPRQVQATVNRNLTAMIDHYTATLLQWDGSSFVPLAVPLSATTTELALPKFAFRHLGPGRYQVRAIGYNASNAPLTSEGTAEIDMTGNNVDLAPQITVPLSMLPVAFSASLPLPSNAVIPGSVPSWVTGLEAVVSVGGTEIARHSYRPNQAPQLKNMTAGVNYDVAVTAFTTPGYSDADTFVYSADSSAASLDDAPTHAFSWSAPPAVINVPVGSHPRVVTVDTAGNTWVVNEFSGNVTRISVTGSHSTFPAGSTPKAIAVDAAGNAWVPTDGFSYVTRISSTGSLSTFPTGATPRSVAVDAAGNAWVANLGSANVTRISATGSLSTFAVGTTPMAITADAGNNVWVANYGTNDVTRISATGSLSTFPAGTHPRALTVDGGGQIWVLNEGSDNVTRISATGSLSTIPVGSYPQAIALDHNGNIWVANAGGSNVTRISTTGSLSTFAAGWLPLSLAIDQDDNVWVANYSSDNVTRISSTGSLSTFTEGVSPYSVVVDSAGNAWVANYGSDTVTFFAH